MKAQPDFDKLYGLLRQQAEHEFAEYRKVVAPVQAPGSTAIRHAIKVYDPGADEFSIEQTTSQALAAAFEELAQGVDEGTAAHAFEHGGDRFNAARWCREQAERCRKEMLTSLRRWLPDTDWAQATLPTP